ncbi:MAG: NPCBM/NEW2 domain-containing protein [Lachnospiraceae bacterium]|nr:NPCBM/NEW2 domain-containing protein [Lachnospiraceae bacterium]MDD3616987.1 NPCBM/NEW2 domain-containing protein [Lachnospiraceae bacterium]
MRRLYIISLLSLSIVFAAGCGNQKSTSVENSTNNTVAESETQAEASAEVNTETSSESESESTQALIQEQKETEEHIPVNLYELSTIKDDVKISEKGDVTDNYGNVYQTATKVQCYVDHKAYSTYSLDGSYLKLKGTIALPEERKNDDNTKWLEVYSGNTLLYTSDSLTAGTPPISFEVDISGVTELTLYYCSSTGSLVSMYIPQMTVEK